MEAGRRHLPFCNAAVETPRHRLWEWERWLPVRIKAVMGLDKEVAELRDDLPILHQAHGHRTERPG
eukprot:8075929-Heterocapsa_arctica.AAC.1